MDNWRGVQEQQEHERQQWLAEYDRTIGKDMNIDNAFPSKFIKASDLQDRPVRVVMSHVKVEAMAQDSEDEKPVLYFQGKDRGLALNKTNASVISALYGAETDAWAGQPIIIYPTETDFGGKRVACIRVRGPGADTPAAPPPAPEPDDLNDPIPF